MAEDDTPPPLPPSLPPPSEDSGDLDETPSQEKPSKPTFQSLRSMFSSSETMYSPKSATTPPFTFSSSSLYQAGTEPSPSTKSSAGSVILDEELPAGESPRLRHGTLERPKRRTRLPSRTMLQKAPDAQDVEQDEAPEDLLPDLPPDLPPDESFDLPPDADADDPELLEPPPGPPPSLPPPPPNEGSDSPLQPDDLPPAAAPYMLSDEPLSLPAENTPSLLDAPTEATDGWDATPPSAIPTLDRGWTAHVKTGMQRPVSADYSRHQFRLRDAIKPLSAASSPKRPLSSHPSRDTAASLQSSSASSLSSFTERVKKMKEKRVQQRSPQASPTLQQKQSSLGETPPIQHPLTRGTTSLEQKQAGPESPSPSTDLLGSYPSLDSLASTSSAGADSLHSADGGNARQSSLSWKSRFGRDSGHNVHTDRIMPFSDTIPPLSDVPSPPPHHGTGYESPILNEAIPEADLPDLPPPPPPEEDPPDGNPQLDYNDTEPLPPSPKDESPSDSPPPPPSSAMPHEDEPLPLEPPPLPPMDTIPGSASPWQTFPSTLPKKTATDVIGATSERSSPTSSPFGTPSKANFLRSLDLQGREQHPRALDQLALQSMQLSKEERSSANDIAKAIIDSSKNPGASPKLASKEEPVDASTLIATSLPSHKPSISAEGALAGESDRRPSGAEVQDSNCSSPGAPAFGDKVPFYGPNGDINSDSQLDEFGVGLGKLRPKSVSVTPTFPTEQPCLSNRAFSFSNGDVTQHVKVISDSPGDQSPQLKVTRVRRHTWMQEGGLKETSSVGDLRRSPKLSKGLESNSLTDLGEEEEGKRKLLRRTVSPLASSMTASIRTPAHMQASPDDEDVIPCFPPVPPPDGATTPSSDDFLLNDSDAPPPSPPPPPPDEKGSLSELLDSVLHDISSRSSASQQDHNLEERMAETVPVVQSHDSPALQSTPPMVPNSLLPNEDISASRQSVRSEGGVSRDSGLVPHALSVITYGMHQPKVDLTEWDVRHVCNWLESVNLLEVTKIFKAHQVSGPQLLQLDESQLKAMGLMSLSLRQRLLQELAELLGLSREALVARRLASQSFGKEDRGAQPRREKPPSRDRSFTSRDAQQPVDVETVVRAIPKRKPSKEAILEVKRRLSMKLAGQGDAKALKWSVDEVCEWMTLSGLTTFIPIFREFQIDGPMLLSLDYHLFDEIGITVAEEREFILSKIYELKNPVLAAADDELAALLSSYDGEELEKAEAAYTTLIRRFSSGSSRGEGLEISPTPFQFPSHGYQLFSHSSPMISDEPTGPDIEGRWTDLKLLRKASVPSRGFDHSPSSERAGSYSPESGPGSPHDPSRPRKTTPSEVKERSKRRRQRASAYETSCATSPSGQSLSSVSSLDQPAGKPGLIKLYMTDMQPGAEGVVYKVLQANLHTTSEEIVEAALEKANIIDDPKRFYLAITSKNETSPCREVSSSERPLLIQRRWEANGQKAFELKVKPSIPLQVTVDLPNIPTGVHSLLVHKMATCSSAVSVLVRKLGVRPTAGKRFCLVQHNRKTKVTRVLKATALLLRVQATWGEEPCQFVLKELPVSKEKEERLSVVEAKNDEYIWKRKIAALEKERDEILKLLPQHSINTQLRNQNARSSWYSALSGYPRHEVFLIECAPGERGLGVVISAEEGRGCVIKSVTAKCPFASQVNIGDRLLEVNGHDVAHATPEGVKSILQNTSSSIQLVVARQQVEPERREEIGGSAVPGQMQESRDSLQEELQAERTEAQKWKELYEQLLTATDYNTGQSSERVGHLQLEMEELRQQLSASCSARDQLRQTVDELQHSLTTIEGEEQRRGSEEFSLLQRKVDELQAQNNKLELARQNTVESVQVVEKERDSLMRYIQKQLVAVVPPDMVRQDHASRRSDVLSPSHPPDELLTALKDTEEELERQRAYLDLLLSVVIERDPETLGMLSDVQKKRVSQGWL